MSKWSLDGSQVINQHLEQTHTHTAKERVKGRKCRCVTALNYNLLRRGCCIIWTNIDKSFCQSTRQTNTVYIPNAAVRASLNANYKFIAQDRKQHPQNIAALRTGLLRYDTWWIIQTFDRFVSIILRFVNVPFLLLFISKLGGCITRDHI